MVETAAPRVGGGFMFFTRLQTICNGFIKKNLSLDIYLPVGFPWWVTIFSLNYFLKIASKWSVTRKKHEITDSTTKLYKPVPIKVKNQYDV